MARRNLYAEAEAIAASQFAPQVAALGEALTQAKADRNAALHTAAAASKGIGRAINRAGSSVKKAYDLKGLGLGGGQSYSSGAYGAAAANERAVTGTALASSLANSLKELSDRRIEAAAGRAYRSAAAQGDYAASVSKIRSQRQSLAGQQGLATAATLSKLTEAQAGRDFTAHENELSRLATANENAAQRQFTHHEDALDRRNSRINAGRSADAELTKLASQQQFTATQNAKSRKNARIIAGMRTDPDTASVTQHVAGQRQKIRQAADWYEALNSGKAAVVPTGKGKTKTIKSMPELHRFLSENGAPQSVIFAASNLGTKGYVAPREVKALQDLGVTVPKDWTGVTIKPHTRRRRRSK